jgi:hypothetical protein
MKMDTTSYLCGLAGFGRPRALLWAVLGCFAASGLLAQSARGIRVIEAGAIPYTNFLSKAAFDKRFAGEMRADLSTLDSGWYVIYEHEMLSYYFGPILLESTGEDYFSKLKLSVEAAVAQRPSIQDYRLELSYEPSTPPSNPAAEEPAGDLGAPPPAPPTPSIWGFIKRLFGF